MNSKLTFCLAALVASGAIARDSTAACEDPAYREFDFWIGDWDVYADDKLAGSNRITREYGGCVVHERYTTPRGYSGESLNTYDVGRKVWHQTWVDNEGALLLLVGRASARRMTLEGSSIAKDGKVTKHRIEWSANADGTVRQFWQSTDATGAWVTAFDGRYVRRKDAASPTDRGEKSRQ